MLEASILQKLAAAHQPGGSGSQPLGLGVYYKNTLVALCHALEDSILASDSAPVMITAFQLGKWYLQEADRYGIIAERAAQVAIMAAPSAGFEEHPTSKHERVAIVPLKLDDPVAWEWHLIIASPDYTAMVLCQELSPEDYGAGGMPENDLERKFYGFWTFDPKLVLETMELAIAHIGTYNPSLQQTLQNILTPYMQDPDKLAPTPEFIGDVVSKVVEYLQTSQNGLDEREHLMLSQNLVSNELQAFLRVAQLVDLYDTTNHLAATEVSALMEVMGQLLDLPAWQVKRLRLAGLMHRLAPYCLGTVAMGNLHEQSLRIMPRLQAIAYIVTHQDEWWNGKGQPDGLAGEAIPLESRLLGMMVQFQQRLNQALAAGDRDRADCLRAALEECQKEAGDRWEPRLVDTLGLLVLGLQQGLTLPTSNPKLSSSMWLLDDRIALSRDRVVTAP